VALAAVNVGVGSEDVGDWLGSVWHVCVGHCCGSGIGCGCGSGDSELVG